MALNIAIEILILWAVYAIYMGIVVFKRGPVGGLCFYPKVMQKRVIELGLISEKEFRASVGFIQRYKFFSSAPKEVRAVVPKTKPERFRGQHVIGWVMIVISFALMGGAIILGALNGIENDYTFWQFYVRFFIMLILLKAFDIGFFDWVLLSNAGFNFFTYFYPECKQVLGHYLFGYNWKTHLLHVLIFFPGVAVLSWICTLFT